MMMIMTIIITMIKWCYSFDYCNNNDNHDNENMNDDDIKDDYSYVDNVDDCMDECGC